MDDRRQSSDGDRRPSVGNIGGVPEVGDDPRLRIGPTQNDKLQPTDDPRRLNGASDENGAPAETARPVNFLGRLTAGVFAWRTWVSTERSSASPARASQDERELAEPDGEDRPQLEDAAAATDNVDSPERDPSAAGTEVDSAEEGLSAGRPLSSRPIDPKPGPPVDIDSATDHDVQRPDGDDQKRTTELAAPSTTRLPHGSTPVRRRFTSETLGIAILVVLALVCAGLIVAVLHKTQTDAATATRDAAAYTPPPLAWPTVAASPTPVSSSGSIGPRKTVVVIGDETASTAADGVGASARWPKLIGTSLKAKVVSLSVKGAGYVATGSSGRTLGNQVDDLPKDADVVLFTGGIHDANVSALALAQAATQAFADAHERAPDASIVVIGPVVTANVSDTRLQALRTTLLQAARLGKATWADPIDARWLGADPRPDASALTATDEKAIARRISSLVRSTTDRE